MSPEIVERSTGAGGSTGCDRTREASPVEPAVAGPGPGPGLPAAGGDRALGVRPAVRLPGDPHRDVRVTTGRVDWVDLALVTVAMVAPRTFAMAANRIIDRQIDARNPRTAGARAGDRRGQSVRTAWTGAVVALVVFLAAAVALNPLCLALAPVAVIPLVVYPYAQTLHQLAARFPGAGSVDGADRGVGWR